jgi:heterodisulfide reductase subunit C
MRAELSPERLRGEFVRKVEEISGQNLLSCYQCGKCSAGCPMVSSMDILPNQLIRLAQLGLEEDVAESNVVWVCASCLACAVRCPRGVDLAKVMEALRAIVLRRNVDYVDPTKIPPESLAGFPQIALVSSFMKGTS